jgi:2'-5' RNA ligase
MYTIAIFPEFKEIEKINSIRKKYDTSFSWLKPHIALVYYFKEKPTRGKINKIIKNIPSFEVSLDKVSISPKGNLIFFDVTKGKKNIINLKKILYRGLGLNWDKDFSYSPHITLANLKTKEEQEKVLNEIKKENLNFLVKINSFSLLEIPEGTNEIKSEIKFNLQ